jgi:hypothetical protein
LLHDVAAEPAPADESDTDLDAPLDDLLRR